MAGQGLPMMSLRLLILQFCFWSGLILFEFGRLEGKNDQPSAAYWVPASSLLGIGAAIAAYARIRRRLVGGRIGM